MRNENLTLEHQQVIIKINEAIDEGLRRGLIVLQGPFQSGKTALLLEILRQRSFAANDHYLNLNQYLLQELSREIRTKSALNLHVLSRLKAKTSQLFEDFIEQFLKDFFQKQNFLIIDSVELLLNYPVNLPQIAYQFCRDSNTIIIAVPRDLRAGFDLNWTYQLARIIELKDI